MTGLPGTIDLSLTTLDGSNGFTITGTAAGDRLGSSVSNAGDVNGDGIDDIVIGAFGADPSRTDAGDAYVVFGRNGGLGFSDLVASALNGLNGFKMSGAYPGDGAGFDVSGAGDINNDGIDDLLIGSPLASDDIASSFGEATVVLGRNTGFSARIDLRALTAETGTYITGLDAFDELGQSVTDLGDVDGDGIDDFAISVRGDDQNGTNSGKVYVVYGNENGLGSSISPSSIGGSVGFEIIGIAASARLGDEIGRAGDFNGDGINDIIVGAPDDFGAGPATGAAYLLFGAASPRTDFPVSNVGQGAGFKILGIDLNDDTGHSVSGAGDINGDGFDDLIIGAPFAESEGLNRGEAYVIFGTDQNLDELSTLDLRNLDGTNGFVIEAGLSNTRFGRSVEAAGDVNGDGLDDLIISSDDSAVGVTIIYGRRDSFGERLIVGSLDPRLGTQIFVEQPDSMLNDANASGAPMLFMAMPPPVRPMILYLALKAKVLLTAICCKASLLIAIPMAAQLPYNRSRGLNSQS